jgi:hypothetical protein
MCKGAAAPDFLETFLRSVNISLDLYRLSIVGQKNSKQLMEKRAG